MGRWQIGLIAAICVAGSGGLATAAELRAEMHKATPTGPGEAVGTVIISDGSGGGTVKTALNGLPPGPHGFHVHQNGSCDPTTPAGGQPMPAGAAGGHYDPQNTGKHGTPWGDGHLGDLPALYVDEEGNARQPVLAPRLKKEGEIKGRSLMVHIGGDNHADHPEPLGGGGARVACGVIQ